MKKDDEATAAAGDGAEITPLMVSGVGYCCTDLCPQYDGKRCQLLGHRPSGVCEPWASRLAAENLRLREAAGAIDRIWRTSPAGDEDDCNDMARPARAALEGRPAATAAVAAQSPPTPVAPPIAHGDVVALRSGGPEMTVTLVEGDLAHCEWCEGRGAASGKTRWEWRRAEVAVVALRRAAPPA